jgi:hypothetical protein
MDGLPGHFSVLPGEYLLAPVQSPHVKMDAIHVILLPIPTSYSQAKDDTIGKITAFAYDCLKNNGLVRTMPRCSP